MWQPGVGLQPSMKTEMETKVINGQEVAVPHTTVTLPSFSTENNHSIYDRIMAVKLAKKNPPGIKIPKEQRVIKLNMSLPRDLYKELKAQQGHLSTHVERACRFYLEIIKEKPTEDSKE